MVFKKVIGFILFAAILLVFPLQSYSAVLINEFLANGLNDPDYEWVELLNNGTSQINLTNWNISESFSDNFTLSTIISPNEYIILAVDFSTFNLTYPNVNASGIRIIDITITNFNLADTSGEVRLYNSSGALVNSIAYVQASGKTFENVSVGRYPDGSSGTFNLSTQTPGAKNDNQNPRLNKWVNPSRNSTNVSGLFTIAVNITDDTTQVNSTFILLNSTNYSMAKNGDLWTFLWNTSLNTQKLYNITVFFNDSYGKTGSDKLINILANNSPRIDAFSPSNLIQTLAEGSTISFNVNASDPDDSSVSFSWFVNSTINSINPSNFSYTPGFSDSGIHIVNVTVKDAANQVSMKWTITVTNVNRAPSLDAISSKTFPKNTNSSFNITAADLDNDTITFSSNKSAVLISKINNSVATVSWKPTNLDFGTHTVNFTASDGSLADSEIVTITVNFTGNAAPNITTIAKTIAIINEQYSYDADAVDSDNDTLRFSLKTNASGMSIDSSSGVITFNPASKGFFSVNVSATDLIEITNQSFNLESIFGSRLKIDDLDVKVDNRKSSNIANSTKISKEAKPGSSVEFRVAVKNDFTNSEDVDIEDIEVKVTIEEIDNDEDDLEEESKEFDLGPEDDKTVALKFELPLNIDDGTFDVVIEAEGEDGNGNKQRQFFEVELEVEKEKHDLRFSGFDLSPIMKNCDITLGFDYSIINLGLEDEENAVLEIKSGEIGIKYLQNFSLEAGTEDNTISNSGKIKVDNMVENGVYKINANLYSDDSKLRDTITKEVKIDECVKEAAESQKVLTTQTSQPMATEAVKEQIKALPIEILLKEADSNMQLLAVSTLVFTLFFVFTAILLYARL